MLPSRLLLLRNTLAVKRPLALLLLRGELQTTPRYSRTISTRDISKQFARQSHPPGITIPQRRTVSTTYPPTLPAFTLAHKTIIITGGARGIGYQQTVSCLHSGATVHVFDLPPSPPTSSTLFHTHPSLHYHSLDVRDEGAVGAAVREVGRGKGRIDGLVCAAGINFECEALEYGGEEWRRMFDVNVLGVFLCAREVVREMRRLKGVEGERGSGGGENLMASVVFIASMSARIANRGLICSAYNASKAAVAQLTRGLAAEWGQYGVRVNSISPGYCVTEMVEQLFVEYPERREKWAAENMLGRLSRPEEYGPAAVFLLSDASSFMTGADLLMDGGHSSW